MSAALAITLRAVPGSASQWEMEAKTAGGILEAQVRGTWPVVVAALSAFVSQLA